MKLFATAITLILTNFTFAKTELRFHETLREQARKVLAKQCGACHTPDLPTTKSAALLVFNLSKFKWEEDASPSQRKNIIWRLEERYTMTKQEIFYLMPKDSPIPPPPSKQDISKVQNFLGTL